MHIILPYIPLIIFLTNDYLTNYISKEILDIFSVFFISFGIITYENNLFSLSIILYLSFFILQYSCRLNEIENTIEHKYSENFVTNKEELYNNVVSTCKRKIDVDENEANINEANIDENNKEINKKRENENINFNIYDEYNYDYDMDIEKSLNNTSFAHRDLIDQNEVKEINLIAYNT